MNQPLENFPRVPRKPEPLKISEADLQKGVIDVARILGYRVCHFRPAQTKHGWRTAVAANGTGFVDLVLVGRGRVLFRELKVGRNTLSVEQAAWIEMLRANGADAGVWTETDWTAGLIEAELRRKPESEAA